MNRGKVRQAGRVEQRYLRLRLVRGARHAEHALTLVGDAALDSRAAVDALAGLRSALPELADDPHLLLPTDVASTRSVRGGALPRSGEVIERVLDAARGDDLVGFFAAGPVYRGFANSEGQRNWHAVSTFNLDWSLYHRADKAVKSMYAGFDWSDDAFAAQDGRRARAARADRASAEVARARAAIARGSRRPRWRRSRACCAGARSPVARIATKQSALTRMEGGERLDPRVTMFEDFAGGVAPGFQGEGFTRPPRVPLIERGALAGTLVSPRTAREFGIAANGANSVGVARGARDGRRHAEGARRARRARHRPLRRQPLVHELFGPSRVPDDRDDALRDVLGRGREDRRADQRDALRRHAVPDVRRASRRSLRRRPS